MRSKIELVEMARAAYYDQNRDVMKVLFQEIMKEDGDKIANRYQACVESAIKATGGDGLVLASDMGFSFFTTAYCTGYTQALLDYDRAPERNSDINQ